jgi:hypothetical protein
LLTPINYSPCFLELINNRGEDNSFLAVFVTVSTPNTSLAVRMFMVVEENDMERGQSDESEGRMKVFLRAMLILE